MNRQITIQLPLVVLDHISTLASEKNETVSHFITQYIVSTLVRPTNTDIKSYPDKVELKKRVHSLRGIFNNCTISDEEALNEYISEKYNV